MPPRGARGFGLLGRNGEAYPAPFAPRAPQGPPADPSQSAPAPPAPDATTTEPDEPEQPTETQSPPNNQPTNPPNNGGGGGTSSNPNNGGNGGHNTPPPTSPPPQQPRPSFTPSMSMSVEKSTAADGWIIIVTHTVSVSAPVTPLPDASDKPKGGDGGGGMSKATITGIGVAGGIAALAVIAFIIWKVMAARRRNEFDADEIKWPELKEENHALPARPTGRHGAGLDGEDDATTVSGSAYSGQGAGGPYGPGHIHNDSASQLLPAGSNYGAYPPNQYYGDNQVPYSDNPAGPYNDPYAGGAVAGGAPMMAMAGRQSPGPGVAYGARAASPGPGVAYPAPPAGGRAASPGPAMAMAYGGRAASPGPAVAYGGGGGPGPRAASPGPAMAYGGGGSIGGRAASPGPNAAYGGYDAGRRSPGPNQAYGL